MFKATHGLPAFQVCDMWDICSLQQPDEPHRITWPWHDLCEMVLTNFTNGKNLLHIERMKQLQASGQSPPWFGTSPGSI